MSKEKVKEKIKIKNKYKEKIKNKVKEGDKIKCPHCGKNFKLKQSHKNEAKVQKPNN